MWKAVFASVGAAVGPFVGGLVGHFLVSPASASRPPVYWLGLPPVWYVVVPVGAALLALLGFWLGSLLDRRSFRGDSAQKWKAVFTALGAAIGPVIGFHTVDRVSLWFTRLSGHGNEWSGLGALAMGLLFGVPIGGIVFCLLGLYVGEALDARSRRNDSPNSGSPQRKPGESQ